MTLGGVLVNPSPAALPCPRRKSGLGIAGRQQFVRDPNTLWSFRGWPHSDMARSTDHRIIASFSPQTKRSSEVSNPPFL